jgi:hypothetical protein
MSKDNESNMTKILMEASKRLDSNGSCPGFYQCSNREFESGKVDCEECKEDALSAMRAFEVGG